MENGLAVSVTDLECRSGQMVLSMKDSGRITGLTVKANSFILMVIFTMVTGLMTKPMGMESITILTAPCTKASGEMISNTEKVKRAGQMVQSMKETTWQERSTASAFTAGTTAASILVIGVKTRSRALALTAG